MRLEARLRSMMTYAERGNQTHSCRLEQLILRLDQAAADLLALEPTWLSRHRPQSVLLLPVLLLAPGPLSEPRGPRQPMTPGILRRPDPDPVLEQWRLALRRYNDLFVDDLTRVRYFLETRILPGSTDEARYLAIETVSDFLAFAHLRRLRRDPPAALRKHFDLEEDPGGIWREDNWITCENFLIHRNTAHLRLAGGHAA